MAIPATWTQFSPLKNRKPLVGSMTGQETAFKPQMQAFSTPQEGMVYAQSPSVPTLPNNYGFNELANYEEARRKAFGGTASADILSTRDKLAKSLADQGKSFFEMQNPYILQDLNARGLASSPTEVGRSQAEALKQIELGNQDYLREFDTSALSARLQAEQDALDSGLDLRRGKLEGDLANAQSAREEALARDLAKRSSRNQLTNSLIGVGGSVLGAGLMPGGFLGLGGGGAGAAGAGAAAATGAGAGGIPLASAGGAGAGIGSFALPAAGAAAGLGLYEESRKRLRKEGFGKGASKVLGAVPGVGLSVVLGKRAANKLGFGAGKTSQQQEGINLGQSEDPAIQGIFDKIHSKSQVGTFNEGQISEAANQEEILARKLKKGEITKEEYKKSVSAFLPAIYSSFVNNIQSGSAAASAFNNSGISQQIQSSYSRYKKNTA